MAVSRARKITFDILLRVESENAYASELLHSALGPQVSAADAGLATEITMGVLRWRRLLDFLLTRHLDKPIERLDLAVAIALRMGAFQLRFLERVPPSAAVNESVELVKRARKSSAASLVNAVLRQFAARAKALAEPLVGRDADRAERLGILHSHPTWLVRRWLDGFGERRTEGMLIADNSAPSLSCIINREEDREATLVEMRAAGLRIEPGRLLKNAFIASGGGVARTEAFRSGRISIQDEASQAVPLLLGVQAGERVLDLCAAPGGKTAILARAAGENGEVIAADVHLHRLRALQEQLKRIGMQNVRLAQLDATHPLPLASDFDAILVDAPCSGTGTLARHSEIRWRLSTGQLAEFHELQFRLFSNAIGHLAPGGRLVYSTCSLEPEENEEVVARALRDNPSLRRIPQAEAASSLVPHLAPDVSADTLCDEQRQFRILPSQYGTDGFFATVLTRD
jgi:16S rRNA (cytosine967-C5)-methyltransferase